MTTKTPQRTPPQILERGLRGKKILIGILVVGIILIAGWWVWNKQKTGVISYCGITDPLYCKSDNDCVCVENAGCFLGNKDYYEKCVNKTGMCFDHCTGWSQPPVKCIDNQCTNSYEIEQKATTTGDICELDKVYQGTPESQCKCPLGSEVLNLTVYKTPPPNIYSYVCKQLVKITTDKTEYEQGETIKITAGNGSDKSIWYIGERVFWSLEVFKNNTWKNIGFEYGPSQLPVEYEGKWTCRLIKYELAEPTELKPNSEIADKWNQKICLIKDKRSIDFPFEPILIGLGRYRFTFTYGLNKSNLNLIDEKTIYSNEFTIKETK